jgi:hypothetical protein
LGEEVLLQLGSIPWRDVGNCAEGKAVLLPHNYQGAVTVRLNVVVRTIVPSAAVTVMA